MKTRVRVTDKQITEAQIKFVSEGYPKFIELEAEVIEEKCDAEYFIEFVKERVRLCSYYKYSDVGLDIATSLLSENAIKPEFLVKLRKGEK